MRNGSAFRIVQASYKDWKRFVDLSTKSDGWSIAYEDFGVYKKAFGEENAEFLAAKGKDGDVLGFVSIAKFDSKIVSFGNYYVHPSYRDKGIGKQLFDKIIQPSTAEDWNIGLNAASNMSKWYAEKGFDKFAGWNLRLHAVTGADLANIAALAMHSKIISPAEVDFAKIADYDRRVAAKIDRSKWLEAWINHPTGWSKVALNAHDEIIGYGTARVALANKLVFGPLYANDKKTAAALMKSILEEDKNYANRQIEFLSPSTNMDMNELAMLLSIRRGTYEHRGDDIFSQFTKNVLAVDVRKVFAIADIALSFI